jgi:hypothetical protein
MAAVVAKDAPVSVAVAFESVEAIDKALSAEKAKLAEASAARDQCRDRRKRFAQLDDKSSYLKEKRAEDELDFELESAQAKIDKLQAARPAAIVREEAARLSSERAVLAEKVKKFQNGDLKKIEEAIAFLSDALHREAALYGELTNFSTRAHAAGLDPVEDPEVSRRAPSVPARQDGTRKVQRSRLRIPVGNSAGSIGGPDRYETYMADEPVIIPEVPEFKPAPLFLRIIIPSFRRGGPKYSPRNESLPWPSL